MTAAAVTMVWNDNWFLARWLLYYGPRLGRENLFVILHGPDPVAETLAEGCSILRLPRDAVTVDFDVIRWRFLSQTVTALTEFYHAVLCVDVDELVLPSRPDASLAEVLAGLPKGRPWSIPGFELFPNSPGADDYRQGQSIGGQCATGLFSPFYSKTCLTTGPVEFSPGAHGAGGVPHLTDQLALLHLRFVSTDELERRRTAREDVAQAAYRLAEVQTEDMVASGRLVSWALARKRHRRLFRDVAGCEKLPWDEGFGRAFALLPELVYDVRGHQQFRRDRHTPFAVQLPDFIADQF